MQGNSLSQTADCACLCAPMPPDFSSCFFFFNDTATTEIYTLSYTTLFRSSGRWNLRRRQFGQRPLVLPGHQRPRSEEHTSELQSQSNLVCRLLLEKKKGYDVLSAAQANGRVPLDLNLLTETCGMRPCRARC